MDLNSHAFILSPAKESIWDRDSGLFVWRCDICRNFFLAKTETLLRVKWDEDLKLCEHEDFFWRYKQAGYKVYWTGDISGKYIDFKPPEYVKMRTRMYTVFRKVLQKKYGIRGWVIYKNKIYTGTEKPKGGRQ